MQIIIDVTSFGWTCSSIFRAHTPAERLREQHPLPATGAVQKPVSVSLLLLLLPPSSRAERSTIALPAGAHAPEGRFSSFRRVSGVIFVRVRGGNFIAGIADAEMEAEVKHYSIDLSVRRLRHAHTAHLALSHMSKRPESSSSLIKAL